MHMTPTAPPPFGGEPGDERRRSGMRTWRVGSLSMGITLMLIGTAFAVSLWQDVEAYELLLWVAPVVFILLGTELLLYLKMSGDRQAIVRYDWLSVFFVGMIGMASLGLALLMSTGLFEELKLGMQTAQRTAYVDTAKIEVPDGVTRIVVQSTGGVTLTEADTREVHLMGQIRYRSDEPLPSIGEDLMRTQVVGDALYVIIGAADRRDGAFVDNAVTPMLMLAIPKGMTVSTPGG